MIYFGKQKYGKLKIETNLEKEGFFMRILEQIMNLETALPYLKLAGARETNVSPVHYRVDNIQSLGSALKILKELNNFDDIFASLETEYSIIMNTTSLNLSFRESQYDDLKAKINKLHNSASTLLKALKNSYELIHEDDTSTAENSIIISMKLPPSYNTLNDLVSFVEDLEFIFRSVLPKKNIEFKGFDVGSDWIRLAFEQIESFDVFKLLLVQTYSYVLFKLKNKEMNKNNKPEIDDNDLKQLGIDITEEQAKQLLVRMMKKKEEQYLKKLAEEVLTNEDEKHKEEELRKIEKSIEKLASLILKKTEVEVETRLMNSNEETDEMDQLELPKIEIEKVLLDNTKDYFLSDFKDQNNEESESDNEN